MPSQLHETLILLFRERPELLRLLLTQRSELGDLVLPTEAQVELVAESFSELYPPTYAADAVFRFKDHHSQPLLQVVLEVQLGIDMAKELSWPLYGVGLRARDRIPTVVVVIAPDMLVAEWCARPIVLDPAGSVYRTVVLGPADIPRITDPDQARALPEMAVLSAVAHGKEADALDVALAALAGCAPLDSARYCLYTDLVHASLSEALAAALEDAMNLSKFEPQSKFARKHFGQGLLEGRRSVLLMQLGQRFGAVPQEITARIQAAETAQLDRWLTRLLSAPTLDAVFADEPATDAGNA